MSTCSDDCICCCLPCIVCWGCVYCSYVGVRNACKYCYKLCRPGSSSSGDGHHETRKSSNRHSLNSNQPSSSSKQHLRDMESTSPDSPVSLKIPAPVHQNPTIRSQPLPVIDMTSGLPSRTSPSASSSRRASPTSLSYSDRYRPQHRSSLASNSFTADFIPNRQNDPLSDPIDVPKSTRPKAKLHLDKPKSGDATKVVDVDSGITLEARHPHEVHAANRIYFDRPSSS